MLVGNRWKLASFLICAIASLLLISLSPLALADGEFARVGLRAGEIAPDFELLDHRGNSHRLRDFRGKPVLLNFWASWCTPCRMEMKDLVESSHLYQDKVQFFGVNLADRDAPSVSQAFLKKFKVGYPNVLDLEGKVADQYQVLVIPTSVLLDAQGRVVQRVQGPLSNEAIDRLFQSVLPKLR